MGYNETLNHILNKFGIVPSDEPSPWYIKGVGRSILPDIFRGLNFTSGVEVGVYAGEFSAEICSKNPQLKMTCVDAWTPYAGYKDYQKQTTLLSAYDEAMKRLEPFNCRIIHAFSQDAAKKVDDDSLDFAYIDANHSFEGCVADFASWIPKVKVGGIIAGHDWEVFRRGRNMRVIEAVDGWTKAYDIHPWFVLGRTKTRKGEYRDEVRSFMWVNR